jgi:multimeric flavodoxin WrbA
LSLALTSQIRAFLDRCTAFLSSPSTGPSTDDPAASSSSRDLASEPWASPDEVLRLHDEFSAHVQEGAARVVGQMRMYLVEDKTVRVLVGPLWDEVGETYATFYNRACAPRAPSLGKIEFAADP